MAYSFGRERGDEIRLFSVVSVVRACVPVMLGKAPRRYRPILLAAILPYARRHFCRKGRREISRVALAARPNNEFPDDCRQGR